MSENIEAEIRSLILEKQHKDLLQFFKKEGKFLGTENQTTFYFSGDVDLRIQQSDNAAKIWLKKGKLHDDWREEIELPLEKKQFEEAEKLFLALGHTIEIKWFRKRNTFVWKNLKVMLDETRGYGYIIELEKMCSEEKKEETVKMLREKLNELKIKETSKEEFNQKFEDYKNNWQKLTA